MHCFRFGDNLRMDTLELFRTYRAVVAHGSFSKAAERLGMSKGNASKYVAALEDRMGVRLLNRSTRSVSLTDAGALLIERLEPLLDFADMTREALQERAAQPSGRLRVSSVAFLSGSVLTDALGSFAQAHPKVHLSVEFTNRRVDLVEEAVDLAIRAGPLRDSELIVRKLVPLTMAVAASPAYWAAHGSPRHPNELSAHRCLMYASENSARSDHQRWMFQTAGKSFEVPVSGPFDSNDGRPLAKWAMQGLGVICVPRPIILEELAAGQLEAVLDDFAPSDFWLVAAYAQRRHNSAALKALVAHLEANIGSF
jgi:DNA-binding transcriptional LysR family regulator